jgi:hypothetical protein
MLEQVNDEFFDEAGTRRVSNRAVVSSILAFFGGLGATLMPLPTLVAAAFLLIAIAVAISAIRTLNHPEARVIGGLRHVGIVLAGMGVVVATIGLGLRLLLALRG